jgi:hypothetical protein
VITDKKALHEHLDKITKDIIFSAVSGIEELDDDSVIATVSGYHGNHYKKQVLIVDVDGYPYRLTVESRLEKDLLK